MYIILLKIFLQELTFTLVENKDKIVYVTVTIVYDYYFLQQFSSKIIKTKEQPQKRYADCVKEHMLRKKESSELTIDRGEWTRITQSTDPE